MDGINPDGFSGSTLNRPLATMGGKSEGGSARFGAVWLSIEGAIGGFCSGAATCGWAVVDVGVWPGREVGVYSVVWFAVGAAARFS